MTESQRSVIESRLAELTDEEREGFNAAIATEAHWALRADPGCGPENDPVGLFLSQGHDAETILLIGGVGPSDEGPSP